MPLSEVSTSVSDHYTTAYKTPNLLDLYLPQTGLKLGNKNQVTSTATLQVGTLNRAARLMFANRQHKEFLTA